MKLLRMTLLGLAFAVPAACFAQWQWIDKDGRKVFSDQPPPPEVPIKSILKQPGAKGRAVAAEEPASAAASAPAVAAARKTSGNTLKIGGKDKTLEEKKKKAEAEEAEKKNAQEEELAKLRADNCQRAKRTKATFDSGVRIAATNDKGEREFLDDNARAAELKRVTAIIASDCKVAGS
jgi:hypothetical protein